MNRQLQFHSLAKTLESGVYTKVQLLVSTPAGKIREIPLTDYDIHYMLASLADVALVQQRVRERKERENASAQISNK